MDTKTRWQGAEVSVKSRKMEEAKYIRDNLGGGKETAMCVGWKGKIWGGGA